MLIDFGKNTGDFSNLFTLLRVKRAGYSIVGKYIHIGPSIPYLLNQIGGRTRNRTNFKAATVRFAIPRVSQFARRPAEGLFARRKHNLSLVTGNLLIKTRIIFPYFLVTRIFYIRRGSVVCLMPDRCPAG